MKTSRYVKTPDRNKENSTPLSRVASVVLLGVITVISGLAVSLGLGSSSGVAASTNSALTQVAQKRYKPTRAFVVDEQTGKVRMPTKKEITKVMESLSKLGQRSDEGLQQTSVASGGVALDLDGGFNGIMLARPKGDGTWETRCVFTLEEGAEFLGLVEDKSTR